MASRFDVISIVKNRLLIFAICIALLYIYLYIYSLHFLNGSEDVARCPSELENSHVLLSRGRRQDCAKSLESSIFLPLWEGNANSKTLQSDCTCTRQFGFFSGWEGVLDFIKWRAISGSFLEIELPPLRTFPSSHHPSHFTFISIPLRAQIFP